MNHTVSIYCDEAKNAIRYSSYRELEEVLPFSQVAAKFVISGVENYYINGKIFKVKEGQYIVGNSHTLSEITINSKNKDVEGLCIDISEDIIAEVAEYHFEQSQDVKEFVLCDQFLVNTYQSKNSLLGYSLHEISKKLDQGTLKNRLANTEFFYSLAEAVISDQSRIFEQYSRLNHKKQCTNEELFRQLVRTKDLIDDNLLSSNLNIDSLSSYASISKYHFIRLFKTTFNLTPYQYILQKKLEIARHKIAKGFSVSETALFLGFADTPSFSKAFKASFGYSPSSLNKISNN